MVYVQNLSLIATGKDKPEREKKGYGRRVMAGGSIKLTGWLRGGVNSRSMNKIGEYGLVQALRLGKKVVEGRLGAKIRV